MAFNRASHVAHLISVLKKIEPKRLYFSVDGPRQANNKDIHANLEIKRIIKAIDWECEVLTLYSEINLGCKQAVTQGINWFFGQVDEGIILEEDCIPEVSFFRYCTDLLERYRDDQRIMMISGNNMQFGQVRFDSDYYYSLYNHIWGWASWRRAWNLYDYDMKKWPELKRSNQLLDLLNNSSAVKYWTEIFDATYNNKNNSWAYRWTYSCWVSGGLSVLPNKNLVKNIGFGDGATHTSKENRFANMETSEINYPLKHPNFLIRDCKADDFTFNILFRKTLTRKIKDLAKKVLKYE